MIKNKKSIALFLIYLILTITIFSSNKVNATEFVNVNQATGDVNVGVEVMNVPGRNGFDYPLILSYSGGDGIRVTSEPAWVGLGWTLDSDTIAREVVNIPDDLNGLKEDEKFTHLLFNEENVKDKRTWWEKYGYILLFFLIIIIEIIITIVTAGATTEIFLASSSAFTSSIAVYTATIVVSAFLQFTIHTFLTALRVAITGQGLEDLNEKSLLKNLAMSFFASGMGLLNVFQTVGTIPQSLGSFLIFVNLIQRGSSVIQGAQALSALPGILEVKTTQTQLEDYSAEFKKTGFLYDPLDNEIYKADNPIIPYDSGQPDKYFASGKFNGELILASKYIENELPKKQHICNVDETDNCVPSDLNLRIPENYFQLFPKKLEGIEIVKIEFKTNLAESCSSFMPPSAVANTCSQKTFQGYIDQIIVTGLDGARIVYGSPNVDGSIIREHASGFYKYARRDQGDDFTSELWFKYFTYTHHPIQWKVISILSPDYSGPLYPLENEAQTKGSWIAFKYDYANNYKNPSGSCAYIEGEFDGTGIEDEWGDLNKIGKIIDRSYLSEIITPYYKAKFYTNNREDGLESAYWGTGSEGDAKTTPNYNLWRINHANSRNTFSSSTNYCNTNQDAKEKRLDYIELTKRDNNKIISRAYFNNGLSEAEQYSLKKMISEKGDSFQDYGRYTLKTVTLCGVKDDTEKCLDPYKLDYYNH